MEMKVHLIGNKKVSAEFGGYTVTTDQPKEAGGEGSAPSPFQLFLASLATCAGYFVLAFCEKRHIPTDEIEILQRAEWDATVHRVTRVTLEIRIPASFPEKYRDSLVTAVDLCTVKRHLVDPPKFEVLTRTSHLAKGA